MAGQHDSTRRAGAASNASTMSYFVYILKCANGTYYVGHSQSVSARYSRHRDGSGARHTAVNTPEQIAYSEEFDTELGAIRRERQIKRWARGKKQALIDGRMRDLRQLSRSHDHRKKNA